MQHCEQLRLKNKWLQEDLAKAHTPAQQEALRTKLRRHAESMAVQLCLTTLTKQRTQQLKMLIAEGG